MTLLLRLDFVPVCWVLGCGGGGGGGGYGGYSFNGGGYSQWKRRVGKV